VTTVHQFVAGHDGGSGPPLDRTDSVAIGGTATAGDLLLVVTTGVGGAWDEVPAIVDDVSGATGWEVAFDETLTGGEGLRVVGFKRVCVGGETALQTTWSGAVNHVTVGAWLEAPSLPDVVFLSSGNDGASGGQLRFLNSASIPSDGATYVGGVAWGNSGASNANFTLPSVPAMGGVGFTTAGDGAGGIQHYNNDEGIHVTTDQLRYEFAPDSAPRVIMYWWATAESGPPEALIEGSGPLLLDGEIGLEATGGIADVVPAGGLLLAGDVTVETTGGDARLSGTGRLLVGGDVFVSAPLPFPAPVRIPENHLGCGVYQCLAMTRGLGEIVTMLPFSQVEWARVLDETSNATLTIDGVANPRALARCCAALSSLEPEEHELAIYRNGWRVWSGPITDMSFPAEQCVIQASDLSWWLSARTIHENINSVQIDLVNILVAYIQDAMSVDNSAGLRTRVLALAAQLGDRLVESKDHQLAADVIGELARTGVDWTTLDREILLGPLQPQPAPFAGATPYPTLIDANFRVQPTILVSGSQGGNCFYVNGPPNGAGDLIFGEYGPEFPATDDHVAQPAAPDYAEIEEQFGRIERVVTESRILDQPGIDANAKTRYELLKRPLVYISDGALLPTTPIPMEKLLPGSLVNVHLSNVCRVIAEAYRIKSVKVQGNSDGSETVDVQWQPLGTGIVLDGEL
jgi:hypothetical protein